MVLCEDNVMKIQGVEVSRRPLNRTRMESIWLTLSTSVSAWLGMSDGKTRKAEELLVKMRARPLGTFGSQGSS